MEFSDGMIVDSDDSEDVAERSYVIEQIVAAFERDDKTGFAHCIGITIQSDAPSQLNSEAEDELYNSFDTVGYNDADWDGSYREEAREYISERTGVAISQIEIE